MYSLPKQFCIHPIFKFSFIETVLFYQCLLHVEMKGGDTILCSKWHIYPIQILFFSSWMLQLFETLKYQIKVSMDTKCVFFFRDLKSYDIRGKYLKRTRGNALEKIKHPYNPNSIIAKEKKILLKKNEKQIVLNTFSLSFKCLKLRLKLIRSYIRAPLTQRLLHYKNGTYLKTNNHRYNARGKTTDPFWCRRWFI